MSIHTQIKATLFGLAAVTLMSYLQEAPALAQYNTDRYGPQGRSMHTSRSYNPYTEVQTTVRSGPRGGQMTTQRSLQQPQQPQQGGMTTVRTGPAGRQLQTDRYRH